MISRYRDPAIKGLWSEENKYKLWMLVERVAAVAQARHQVIPAGARDGIEQHGRIDPKVVQDIADREETTGHDFVAFLDVWREQLRRAGAEDGARFLHFGLTSSDVQDTALGMLLWQSSTYVQELLSPLMRLLVDLGDQHLGTVRVARTHGQYAEPTTLGVKIMEWLELLKRSSCRLGDAARGVAVGKLSGPVGTYAHNPPEVELEAMGLLDLGSAWGSSQVIARDRLAHWAYCVAAVATACEQIALDFWLLAQSGVQEVQEGYPEGRRGSSSMPHKRNPVTAEKIRGLAHAARRFSEMLQGRVLPLERDIHHSALERIAIPDLLHATCHILVSTDSLLRHAQIDVKRMLANLEDADTEPYTSGVVLALVRLGYARDRAEEWARRWDQADLGGDFEGAASMPSEVRAAMSSDYYTRHLEALRYRFDLQWSF